MRILQVGDRPGWAIDRLSKPLSEIYEEVDMSYFSVNPNRYLDSGYSKKGGTLFTQELANNYDVIHFHRVEAAEQFDLSKIKAKKVITVHTERKEDWEDRRLLDFDLVIAPTQYARQHFIKTFPESMIDTNTQIVHVPHGIDLKKYLVKDIKPKDREVGFVGRIVSWKRWDVIQKAVYNANSKLIGCGYIEDGRISNIHNLCEGTDYEYNSFLQEDLMVDFYHRMNLFICLSAPNIEVGPLPVMEAMACGIPVISTEVGWAKDYCEHGKNIIFVSQETVENYARVSKIIREVYDNKKLRDHLRINALELIKNFSIQNYAKKLMDIYEHSWGI